MAAEIDIVLTAQDKASLQINNVRKSVDKLGESSTTVASKSLKGLQNALSVGLKVAAGAAVVGLGGVAFALRDTIGLARTQINVEKQLDAVLKSTGNAAGLTANELKSMASELQSVTNFSDDTIISGQNLLLTFTNIGKDVFPRATETMLDMSQALGQNMKSSAIQLGKALNDPLTGVSALQEVGVSFTEQQKEQIKTMAEAGDVAKAQGLILDELARQFGGSAQAMADPAIQLSNAWGDFKEQIGIRLIPVIERMSTTLIEKLPEIEKAVIPVIEKIADSIANWIDEVIPLVEEWIPKIANVVSEVRSTLDDFQQKLIQIGSVLQALASPFVSLLRPIIDLASKFVSLQDVMAAVAIVVSVAAVPALAGLAAALAPAAPLLLAIGGLALAIAFIRNAFEQEWAQRSVQAVGDFMNNTKQYLADFPGVVEDKVLKWIASIGATWNRVPEPVRRAAGLIVTSITPVGFAIRTLRMITDQELRNKVVSNFRKAAEIIGGFSSDMADRIDDWWGTVKNNLGNFLNNFLGSFTLLVNKIKDKFDLEEWLNVGIDIIQGLIDGITKKGNDLLSSVDNWIDKMVDNINRKLGRRSPSKLFEDIGFDVMEGLDLGLLSGSDNVLSTMDEFTTDFLTDWDMGFAGSGGIFDTAFSTGKGVWVNVTEGMNQGWQIVEDFMESRITTFQQYQEAFAFGTGNIAANAGAIVAAITSANDLMANQQQIAQGLSETQQATLQMIAEQQAQLASGTEAAAVQTAESLRNERLPIARNIVTNLMSDVRSFATATYRDFMATSGVQTILGQASANVKAFYEAGGRVTQELLRQGITGTTADAIIQQTYQQSAIGRLVSPIQGAFENLRAIPNDIAQGDLAQLLGTLLSLRSRGSGTFQDLGLSSPFGDNPFAAGSQNYSIVFNNSAQSTQSVLENILYLNSLYGNP